MPRSSCEESRRCRAVSSALDVALATPTATVLVLQPVLVVHFGYEATKSALISSLITGWASQAIDGSGWRRKIARSDTILVFLLVLVEGIINDALCVTIGWVLLDGSCNDSEDSNRKEFDNSIIKCKCGSYMPLVKNIEGRKMTFVYSKDRGVVGAGNISNIVKYTYKYVKI